jgi:acetate kinase
MLLNDFIAWIESRLGGGRLAGVGHRIVHGGGCHMQPEKVDTKLLDALDRLSALAPLHEASSVAPMRVIGRLRPNLPQVACFDTAFHRTMPSVATRFGLPRELEDAGIRRYGFHGLSYEYIAGRLREIAPELGGGRIIAAHLGNGASLCAMRAGQSVDTTMGFTPLDGLVMGTRCGNLDPGVILFLEQERGMMASQVEDMLYRRSGLLGVSGGIASDMPTLLASEDTHAVQAVELFVYRIARDVGALTSSLGGLDGIVFTAGIGENASSIREAICARLAWLGVELDAQANEAHAPLISSSRSKVAVRVIPTDEETVIARHTMKVIGL